MIDSLRGQLDAAIDLKDGYARTIEKQKKSILAITEKAMSYSSDAEKWRGRNERERARHQAKRASKTKAGVKK